MAVDVYIGMTLDPLHHGHVRLIQKASRLGLVTIGLLTDQALSAHRPISFLTWEERREIALSLVGVIDVVPQETFNYGPALRQYRPRIMVHGTDWSSNEGAPLRQEAIAELAKYGGELVEFDFVEGIDRRRYRSIMSQQSSASDRRRARLSRLIDSGSLIKLIDVHNPLAALLVEQVAVEMSGEYREYDGFWSSSLVDSAVVGRPDTEVVDLSARLSKINEIFEVTSKPLLMDIDTGGAEEKLKYSIPTIERLGISGVVIEDKEGVKQNSLLGPSAKQRQATVHEFCSKLEVVKASVEDPNFLIVGRIESLILSGDLNDAIERANAYVSAGANAIMIHSRSSDGADAREFCLAFRKSFDTIPLVIVPTTFPSVKDDELKEWGCNVVIYANHVLRGVLPALVKTAGEILRYGRALEAEKDLCSVDKLLNVYGGWT